ncbi:fluoride efflux transporter FluC [Jeotgalibacillus salarius]|uniref:Fluoride-specific ion channel FluC n=1 Tax=Jeotgalibacillus salarius TaxID=546023 RepID=A0A4Y8LGQ2_9BACL|nr:CrcB family protein [Jeotgalibacillus salarius]TFE01630.1 CrcB family protein [Jeotgalibacillus salarius]
MNALWVGLGGSIGVLLRYTVNLTIQSSFPYSTLLVNLLGSFLLGFLSTIPLKLNPHIRLALTTGLIGSFTTLSAVSAELFTFLQAGYYLSAILYFLSSLIFGFTLAYIGIFTGRKVRGLK